MGLGMSQAGHWVPRKRLYKNIHQIAVPQLATTQVRGTVSHVIDPHHFFFLTVDEQVQLQSIYETLNAADGAVGLLPYTDDDIGRIRPGQSLVCSINGARHRARVLRVSTERGAAAAAAAGGWSCSVRLIDFGFEQDDCRLADLLRYPLHTEAGRHLASMPPRCFECRLAELQPSQLISDRGLWTEDAVAAFRGLCQDGKPSVVLHIYSVVERIAHVVAYARNGVDADDGNGGGGGLSNVNEFMVTEGLAQVCEESFASKSDHIRRIDRQRMPFDDHAGRVDEQQLQRMAENPSSDEDDDDGGGGGNASAAAPSAAQCMYTLQLSGPHSPLEARIYGAAGAAEHRTVRIEPNSVNSVLLEDRSQDVHNHVLVAATVTRSAGSAELVARETTQLPCIAGFGALMALIFCPCAELRPDAERTRIVSVLCGLGWNAAAGRPVYEEHDVRFELDVELSGDDLAWINQIRFSMDTLLYTKPGEEQPELSDQHRNEYLMKIKQRLIQ